MAVFVCSTSLYMYGNRSWFKETTFQEKYGHMKILVWSSKFGSKQQRFWSRTNWKRVQTSWRRILGQKKSEGTVSYSEDDLEIQGECRFAQALFSCD